MVICTEILNFHVNKLRKLTLYYAQFDLITYFINEL